MAALDMAYWLEKQKEHGPLSKDEEYTLARIIEYLEDNGCPSKWKDLLYDVYALPYQKERKPAGWSEEDERMFACLWGILNWVEKSNYSSAKNVGKYIDWLQSLKQRLNGTE